MIRRILKAVICRPRSLESAWCWPWVGLAFTILLLSGLLAAGCIPAAPQVSRRATPFLAPTTPIPTPQVPVPVPSDVALAREFNATLAMVHVQELASPAYGGRRAGTPQATLAAEYIAGVFQSLGLQPAGDNGTYFQTFAMPYVDLAAMPQLALLDGNNNVTRAFRPRQEFRELVVGSAGGGEATGQVVFVGQGEARDYDGLDARGKIALIKTPRSTWQAANTAINRGAIGAIIVADDANRLRMRGSYIVPLSSATIPAVLVSEAVANELLQPIGETLQSLQGRPGRLLDVRVRLAVPLIQEQVTSVNVLAMLPGHAPSLKDKVIIVGAHYDHVGTDPDGTVFPGANDDASGVGVLLEIARLLTEKAYRPKATILFAAWGGEEAGLLGSRHYVANPRFPLRDTLAMLQLDVVGQGKGPTLNITRSPGDLAARVHQAARDLGIATGVEQIQGGSDHQAFLEKNVPAVLLVWAEVMDLIHIPEDMPQGLDPAKLTQAGQVATLAVLRLADGR